MNFTQNQVSKRPEFLTVICILSFIGQGYLLLKNLLSLVTISIITRLEPVVERSLEEFDYHGPFRRFLHDSLEYAVDSIDNFLTLVLGKIFLVGIILYGVILMWNLKKNGFYLFIAGKFFYILFPASLVDFNSFSVIDISIKSTIAIIFIILYSLNFKDMK